MNVATTLAFLSPGLFEIMVIGVVALLVFGGNLPDVMRNVGRAYAKFRQGLQDISKPVREEIRQVRELPQSAPMQGSDGERRNEGNEDLYAPDETPTDDADDSSTSGAPEEEARRRKAQDDGEDTYEGVADEPPPI